MGTVPGDETEFPEVVRKTVYTLYDPEGDKATHDIVFLHGLPSGNIKKAWRTTWEVGGVCWPSEHLRTDFPRARVLSISYSYSYKQASVDIVALGEQLLEHLLGAGVKLGRRPVILIGHSLGGLVLQQVCLEAEKRSCGLDVEDRREADMFMDNIHGIVLFASPHGKKEECQHELPQFARKMMGWGFGILVGAYLAKLSKDGHRTREAFTRLQQRRQWPVFSFFEREKSRTGCFASSKVVWRMTQASLMASSLTCDVNADHMNICKLDQDGEAYQQLRAFITSRLEVEQGIELQYRRRHPLVGRVAQLKEVCQHLLDGKIVILVGESGRGKTRLAAEAASRFRGPHVFIDLSAGGSWQLRTEGEVKDWLARQLLGKLDRLPSQGEEAWKTLEDECERGALLQLFITYDSTEAILHPDGMEATKVDMEPPKREVGATQVDMEATKVEMKATKVFRELVEKLKSAKALQIITTRIEPQPFSDEGRLLLETLPQADAEQLLRSTCGREISSDDMNAIIQRSKCNAQLLRVLGGLIKAAHITPEAFLADDGGQDCQVGEEEQVSNTMADLLDRVPTIRKWVIRMSLWHSFTAEQAGMKDAGLKDAGLKGDTIQSYVRFSVIQSASKSRYCMHLMVRKAAIKLRERAELNERENAQKYFVEGMASVAKQLRIDIDDGKGPAAWAAAWEELPNCLGFCSIPDDLVKKDGDLVKKDGIAQIKTLAETLGKLGFYAGEAVVWTQVIGAQERVLGSDDRATLDSMNNFAMALRRQGKYAHAEASHGEILKARGRVLGPEHPDTLISLSNLAKTLGAQGKYAHAEAMHREVLEAHRRVLGPEHPDTLISLSNLAETLGAQGKYAHAEGMHREVVEARGRVLGPEHPDTLISLSNLAETLGAQGKYAHAEAMHREVLEAHRRVLGPEHPDTLISLSNLAETLGAQGKYAHAEAMHREVLEAHRRVLGPEHPDTLISLSNLAETLGAQGKYAYAEGMHREVVEARGRVLGPEHPDTLISLSNLAETLGAQGKYAYAEGVHREVLEARRRVLGPEHPDTLISRSQLAMALGAQGKYAHAEGMHREVVEARGRVLGPEHPDTLISLSNLAETLGAQGKYAEAEAMHREVLEAERRVLGPEHPSTLTSMSQLAMALVAQGKYAEAEAMHREVLEARRRVLGPEHPSTLASKGNLAAAARRG